MVSKITAHTEIRIEISYSRDFEAGALNGLYVSTYTDEENVPATVLATQFESTSARKAFPSFDEPLYKAAFDLSIVVTDKVDAIANTPGTRTGNVVTFERTPVMSTYLLAMTIMETASFGKRQGDSDKFRTYARLEALKNNQDTLSQEDGLHMIEFLSEWTGISLYDGSVEAKTGMELKKMDQAAIPDFASGAMENWGLITYRENYLLFAQDGSTAAQKRISQVIAHELAHQWFGNWVTTKWWNTIWLNEGFADLFEYIVMADRYDTWLMDERMVLDEQMYAFDADSSSTSPALTLPEDKVENPDEISGHFGTITYSKGGSILRQIRNVIGGDNFKAAIQGYLANMAFQSAVPEDLFAHFIENNDDETKLSDKELLEVLENWTNDAGYPVVTVEKFNDTAISITQSRFLLKTSDDATGSYDIFLTWVTDKDDTPTKPLQPEIWLRKGVSSIVVDLGTADWDWVIVNPYQAGYYRVDYSKALWKNLETAMSSQQGLEKISDLDRAALINNALNMGRARGDRNMDYEEVFSFMLFLHHDKEFLPWAAARSALAFVQRVTANSLHYKDFIRKIVEDAFIEVGFEVKGNEGNVAKTHRINVLTLACGAGHSDCLAKAEDLLETALEDNGEDVHADLQSVVYCYGLKRSKAADLWEKLWLKYQAAVKDMTRRQLIASALGCVNDEVKLTNYLEESVKTTGNIIPASERSLAFSAVYANPDGGPEAALTFVEAKTTGTLEAAYGGSKRVAPLLNGLASYLSDDHLPRLEAVTQGKKDYEEAVTTLENNVQWRKDNEEAMTKGLRKAGAPTAALASILALLCAVVLHLFR